MGALREGVFFHPQSPARIAFAGQQRVGKASRAAEDAAHLGQQIAEVDPTARVLDTVEGVRRLTRTADGRAVITPASGRFTSGFGPRWGTFHNGTDFGAPIGTPMFAAKSGTVVAAGPASLACRRRASGQTAMPSSMGAHSMVVA